MKQKVTIGTKRKRDIEMFYSPNNARYIGDVLERAEYEYLFSKLNKINAKNLIVVDIGCNVGSFSFYVYDIAKKIYAIDPVKNCITDLDKTIKENKLRKIKTYEMAIGDKTGKGMLNVVEPDEAGASFLHKDGMREVDVMTLSDFCTSENLHDIDILKIDCEGGEVEIFESTDFTKLNIPLIIGEFHVGKTSSTTFLGLVASKGYTPIEMANNHFIAIKQ